MPANMLAVLKAHRLIRHSAEDAPECSCGDWEPETATRDLEEHEEHVAAMLVREVAPMNARIGTPTLPDRCPSTHPMASHIPCRKPAGHPGDHVSRAGRNWLPAIEVTK